MDYTFCAWRDLDCAACRLVCLHTTDNPSLQRSVKAISETEQCQFITCNAKCSRAWRAAIGEYNSMPKSYITLWPSRNSAQSIQISVLASNCLLNWILDYPHHIVSISAR